MELGQNIRQARKKANLTQKALAEKAGVATVTIQQYEAGKRTPRLNQLIKIAKALGVGLESLADVSSNMISVPIEVGMLGTLEWYAKKKHRTIFKQIDIAIDTYLDFLAMEGELEDETEEDKQESVKSEQNFEKSSRLLEAFNVMNDTGKEIAIERVKELGKIPEYQKVEEPEEPDYE